jgi:hypothetical protein
MSTAMLWAGVRFSGRRATVTDGHTMLDRPWSAEEQARLDATPAFDPLEGVEGPEPIEGEQEAYFEALVGSKVPAAAIRSVEPVKPVTLADSLTIEKLSPKSWRVESFLAGFIFRNVKVGHTPSADVEVFVAGIRVLTTPITLSLTGRRELAKEIDARGGGLESLDYWKKATDLAFEAILDEVRSLGAITDISNTPMLPTDRLLWVLEGLVTVGANSLIAPGAIGKSTMARAACVSVASGRVVIPGYMPRVAGPVLYVVSEDANKATHVLSINKIKEGAGITGALAHRIDWLPTVGQPLHQIVQSVAERARDYAMVVLDAQSGLMSSNGYAGVRSDATDFHNDIDSIGKPVLLIAHPNANESMNWAGSDGRSAGSEIHRDRVRMQHAMWRRRLTPAVGSPPLSVVKMKVTKFNDGPEDGVNYLTMQWSDTMISFMPGDEHLWDSAKPGRAPSVGSRPYTAPVVGASR